MDHAATSGQIVDFVFGAFLVGVRRLVIVDRRLTDAQRLFGIGGITA